MITAVVILLFCDYHWQDIGVAADLDDGALVAFENAQDQSGPVVLGKFSAIRKSYKDVAGSVRISNTGVQYYVFQHSDNAYYVDHNRDSRKSPSGEIFLDHRCTIQPLSRHMILYGHNLYNFSMFSFLDQYKKQRFCMQNPVIHFDTLYGCYNWQIFSVRIVDIDQVGGSVIQTEFADWDDWYRFLLDCQNQSIYPIPVELKKDDIMLTLITCSEEYKNGRLLIQARLIR